MSTCSRYEGDVAEQYCLCTGDWVREKSFLVQLDLPIRQPTVQWESQWLYTVTVINPRVCEILIIHCINSVSESSTDQPLAFLAFAGLRKDVAAALCFGRTL